MKEEIQIACSPLYSNLCTSKQGAYNHCHPRKN